MRRVTFPVSKNGTRFVYPDDKRRFSNVGFLNESTLYAIYSGSLPLDDLPSITRAKTKLGRSELVQLIGRKAYNTLYRAAFPKGNNAEDETAFLFIQLVESAISGDSKLDVSSPDVEIYLDDFVTKGYINASDKERIQKGIEL